MAKGIKWLVVVAIIASVIWWLNRDSSINVSWQHPEIADVATIVANTRSGTVEACQRSKMSFAIGGQIESIYVKEGQMVEQGQRLMMLWQQDRQAKVIEAQALINARTQHQQSICVTAANDKKIVKRHQQLLQQKLTSQEILDNTTAAAEASAAACLSAQSEVDVAKALLQVAEASLAQTELYAPFAGMVAEITGELGEYATPSPPGIPMPPAIDILTHDCHYVTAPIDEVDAGQLTLGMPVTIEIDAFKQHPFNGKIRRISPYVQDYAKQARTVDVDVEFIDEVDNHEPPLLTGYSADIAITVAKADKVLRLPSELVLDNRFVYIVDDNNVVRKQDVEVGLTNWQYSEITQGLKASDRVITSLTVTGLAEGQQANAVQVKAE
ncbi:efflux RND transporter periplasmic adaptor subunit [Colwellia sp. MEBiC06753]